MHGDAEDEGDRGGSTQDPDSVIFKGVHNEIPQGLGRLHNGVIGAISSTSPLLIAGSRRGTFLHRKHKYILICLEGALEALIAFYFL